MKLWLVGVFWADAGRNGTVFDGFEELEEEEEASVLLCVDFALGMDDNGWKKKAKQQVITLKGITIHVKRNRKITLQVTYKVS